MERGPQTERVETPPTQRSAHPRDQLIPLLQDIQAREGYLSQAAMARLAAALGTPVASIYGVATFYNQFRFAPLGRHVIELCRGTACHVKQSLALQQHLERRLKLRPDGNSADRRFTVLKVACLGACSIAPVIKLDGDFYGRLTVEKLDALLDSLDRDDRDGDNRGGDGGAGGHGNGSGHGGNGTGARDAGSRTDAGSREAVRPHQGEEASAA